VLAQLQTGNPTPVPTLLPIPAPVSRVAMGYYGSAALGGDGALYFFGESGNTAATDTSGGWATIASGLALSSGIKTDQVGTDTDWSSVAPGQFGACAIKLDGNMYCWGANDYGTLGQGTAGGPSASPLQVTGSWLDVATSENTACAIASDHTLWCWGDGFANGVGRVIVASPTQLGVDADWLDVDEKWRDACALKQDHSLWCWGGDENGTLEQLFSTTSPVAMGITADALAMGGQFICTHSTGTWSCFGDNVSGELATGDEDPRTVPTPVCP
jgi:alpha-tubulin suppressor-like RCC1 family protein